jgi:hypothetical protein
MGTACPISYGKTTSPVRLRSITTVGNGEVWTWDRNCSTSPNVGWTVVAAADFDRNGIPDLIWQNEITRQVTIHYYGGPQGAVPQGWAWLDRAGAPGWRVVAAADFDGNGVPDLVWQQDGTRKVTVHYYGGARGAIQQGWRWLDEAGEPGWKVAGANDFDRNGVPDLVFVNVSTRQVVVHFYGGPQGAWWQGWTRLNGNGLLGWTPIVPR